MHLLLTNDDGILSPVLHRVAEALARDHSLVVVAPATDQSGKSHSFTHGLDKLLHFQQDQVKPYLIYQVQGTPCDCVKFAVSHLFRHQPFDLVISGINLGENSGVSSIYSGTVAAAREAALWGAPAIAISLWHTATDNLEHAEAWLLAFLDQPELLPRPGEFYNVNFPPCPVSAIAGARITAMSEVMFTDAYVPVINSHGVTGYRLEGHKPAEKFMAGTDDHALAQGFIAITPMRIANSYPEAHARLQSSQASLDHVMRALKPAA
jgi:5'-nucleotidase